MNHRKRRQFKKLKVKLIQTIKTSTTHIDSEKEPSAEEIAIAQTAVKEEARNHDLANPSASGEDTKSKSETETEKLAAAAKAKKR